ncbi:hypothetical protein [Streptomyces sp. NPDC001450]
MRSQRTRRLVAMSAAGVLLAGGAAIGTAGTAFAGSSHDDHGSYSSNCDDHGWWNDDDCDNGGDHGGYGGDHDNGDHGDHGGDHDNGDHGDHGGDHDNGDHGGDHGGY